ncbi:hypothetical protein [Metaclostridioides mangenotii]|uniref:hypothetical protein n=1 Tax=Metaclostridioides mangenotii TaxID=1540 RepID=UPI000467A0E2|nr:hypothetical protein [Clostridioides mangenotii]
MKENHKLVSISLEELKEKNCLYIERIDKGFNNLKHHFIEGNDNELKEYLLQKIDENGIENTYVDFYYSRLNFEERNRVYSDLSQDNKDFINKYMLEEDGIYFQMTPELFEITFKLSITEMLFSTFYFSKFPCTVWSNYNKKFIVFE